MPIKFPNFENETYVKQNNGMKSKLITFITSENNLLNIIMCFEYFLTNIPGKYLSKITMNDHSDYAKSKY